MRIKLDPRKVFCIPNAVDTEKFKPSPEIKNREPKGVINIVYITRMQYRKGVDLLIDILHPSREPQP